jgi:hypothetical protein
MRHVSIQVELGPIPEMLVVRTCQIVQIVPLYSREEVVLFSSPISEDCPGSRQTIVKIRHECVITM